MATASKDFLDITKFKAASLISSKEGLLHANRFIVKITFPEAVRSRSKITDEDLQWNAVAVTCPNHGMEVYTQSINTVTRNHYKLKTDADLNITFIEDADLSIRKFFAEWIRQGYDINSLRRGYHKELVGEIKVFPMAANGEISSGDVFLEVIPTDIANLDYSMFNEDVLLKTSVTFKYKWHDVGTESDIEGLGSKI